MITAASVGRVSVMGVTEILMISQVLWKADIIVMPFTRRLQIALTSGSVDLVSSAFVSRSAGCGRPALSWAKVMLAN